MISTLTCLLFPFLGNCSAFVRDKPNIAQVRQHKPAYSGKSINVTGRVRGLDQWTSAINGEQELFSICEDGCIRVYLRLHSPIHDGQMVTVIGQYFETYHMGRRTYHNEIEAEEVLPRE